MILINFAQMEAMCLWSNCCPHTEKPNHTNPLIQIGLFLSPPLPLLSSDTYLLCLGTVKKMAAFK